MDGIQQLTSVLQHAFPRNSGQSRTYMEIAWSHGVTELNVVGACEEADDWLEKMEDTLEGMSCPAAEWVKIAGYFI